MTRLRVIQEPRNLRELILSKVQLRAMLVHDRTEDFRECSSRCYLIVLHKERLSETLPQTFLTLLMSLFLFPNVSFT